jgi:hypothetical protein
MQPLRARLLLTAFGGGVGLAAALVWWFAWGCRACLRDGSPVNVFVFCVVMGVGMANAWGMDHLRHRR